MRRTYVQTYFTPTTFTCDLYTHHVVIKLFLKADNSKSKQFERVESQKKWNQDVVIISSGIWLSQIFVYSLCAFLKRILRLGGHIGHKWK